MMLGQWMLSTDFSQAVDKIPLGRLIQKIKMHTINIDLIIWIQNWLTGRRQSCGGKIILTLEVCDQWNSLEICSVTSAVCDDV